MAIRIVSDSSSDLLELSDVDYRTVPLRVMFGSREYVDEIGTDAEEMVRKLQAHTGPSTTSCPNVHDWLTSFEGADGVFCVTISSGLSGSFSCAETAAKQYMEENPHAQVYVFDSKATGPVLRLIIEKLREHILEGGSFDEVKAKVIEYQKRIRILYSLESLNNLARNGRVSPAVARIAGVLGIRAIGHASEEGTVELLHRSKGEKRALKAIVSEMMQRKCAGGKVHIDHCLNKQAAEKLKQKILETIPDCSVFIHPCTVLCSYYADIGGLIVGYEVQE